MRKSISEEVSNISVPQNFSRGSGPVFSYEDFVLTPMMHLQALESDIKTFSGVMVCMICSGTVKITIDGKHFELRRNSMMVIHDSSVVSEFKCSKACMGYYITYPNSFVAASSLVTTDWLTINMIFGRSPCLQVCETDIVRLHSIASAFIQTVGINSDEYDRKVQSSLFDAFFYALVSIMKKYATANLDKRERLSRPDDIMRRFTALINTSCERERSVEYYASQLGITPKYLSLVCKKRTGLNASKIIDSAVIRKAKVLLRQQGLSVLEVSERLNFVSQSFFGKYFKQRTGVSPSRYKEQQ